MMPILERNTAMLRICNSIALVLCLRILKSFLLAITRYIFLAYILIVAHGYHVAAWWKKLSVGYFCHMTGLSKGHIALKSSSVRDGSCSSLTACNNSSNAAL